MEDNYKLIEKIKKYADWYKNGAMPKKTAELCSSTYINQYNKIAQQIAKKHGVSAKLIKFSDFTR